MLSSQSARRTVRERAARKTEDVCFAKQTPTYGPKRATPKPKPKRPIMSANYNYFVREERKPGWILEASRKNPCFDPAAPTGDDAPRRKSSNSRLPDQITLASAMSGIISSVAVENFPSSVSATIHQSIVEQTPDD
jgi:hypothetical protein